MCFPILFFVFFFSDFTPRVSSLSVASINSSAIQVQWAEPRLKTSCYTISSYLVNCYRTSEEEGRSLVTSTTPPRSTIYNVTVTDLQPDSRYNCTVEIVYTDLFGGAVNIGTTPAFDIRYTDPRAPNLVQFELLRDEMPSDVQKASLNLTAFRDLLDPTDVSYVHIIVQRLGKSPTLPTESPDKQYTSIDDFSTYELVHSENDQISYRPYIAAEISVEYIPRTFVIGSDDIPQNRRRQEYTNGPLVPEDYYTVFIRVYAYSQWMKQYGVFVSSNFTTPFKSEGSEGGTPSDGTSESAGSGSGAIASTVVVVLLLFIIVAAVVISLVVVYFYKR